MKKLIISLMLALGVIALPVLAETEEKSIAEVIAQNIKSAVVDTALVARDTVAFSALFLLGPPVAAMAIQGKALTWACQAISSHIVKHPVATALLIAALYKATQGDIAEIQSWNKYLFAPISDRVAQSFYDFASLGNVITPLTQKILG